MPKVSQNVIDILNRRRNQLQTEFDALTDRILCLLEELDTIDQFLSK